MRRERILIVAADNGLAKSVKRLLDAEYKVSLAKDGIDGLRKVSRSHPDLVIVESGMPAVNRADPCSRIRQASYLPIIMVGKEQDAVEMLELGADAYVDWNSEFREIVARVRGLLWRKLKTECRPPDFPDRPPAPPPDNTAGASSGLIPDSSGLPVSSPQQLTLRIDTSEEIYITNESTSIGGRELVPKPWSNVASEGGD